ncbi:UvrD-helicase domain-containing protein [Auraticoccus monumenti]|uniref:DNA 3'-5' helicase n=1 Tax=Auraticoccus monumenti TaxID=675864 RepID=A0A1G7AJW3_9ACTN|nr:UvrD-helicase domain-containing protein [Auraticoccus monumenti]SDE15010.1 DNA helicase-2 / ATP-dependent DNA helicase PcrA [Auraticoccus monumenti]
MSAPTRAGRRLDGPEDLCAALGIDFSAEQLAAITAPLEPGVIIAGAGSGKTTVMAARVVWLVGTGAVRPEEVLGLTFTRKAAAELSTRVRAALSVAGVLDTAGVDEAGEQVIMTYDAFAARLVSEHGLRIGVESDPTMITGATRYRLASRVVRAAAGPFEQISRFRPATVTERVLRLDAEMRSHLVESEHLDAHAREMRLGLATAPPTRTGTPYVAVRNASVRLEERLELASLVRDYQRLKERLGVVEFADQMAVAARLAGEVPEVSTILRSQYKVVLLDEYQDTSSAQARLLQSLFSGRTPISGRGHPVTAVGDPFQAIYGWRGAAASNIMAFADDFPDGTGRAARTFSLTVNRRSGQTILDVANVLAVPLRTGDSVVDLTETLLRAPESAGAGQVRAASFDTWPDEVAWIADQVVAAREGEEVPAWSDVAVLTRRNADIARLYAELTSRDVPCEIVGLGGLLDLPEVADVVSTLSVLDDVTANPDLVRLLTGPRWRVGPRDLALLGSRARELAEQRGTTPDPDDDRLLSDLDEAVADVDPTEVTSLLDALEDPGEGPCSEEARHRFARLAGELAALRAHVDEPVLDLTRRVVATLGLDVELVATPELERAQRRDQLAAFLDAIAGYVDVDGDASLAGLLAYLRAELEQGTGLDQAVPSDHDAVKLLTVHRAKGLEWRMVFLPALVEGVFPSDRVTDNWLTNAAVVPAELRGDADSVPQLVEVSNPAFTEYAGDLKREARRAEDRLAYVAATRAKRVLVGSCHRWREGVQKPRKPSPYLQAIWAEAERQERVLHTASVVEPGSANPLIVARTPVPWPAPLDPDALRRRREAAAAVGAARRRAAAGGGHEATGEEPLLLDQEVQLAAWDADLDRLVAEAVQHRSTRRAVRMPGNLSATDLVRAHADPAGYAAELLRPMPRPPSRGALLGTRFHRWVETFLGSTALVDLDELPGRADADLVDERDLDELTRAFAAGQFAGRRPRHLELPFTTVLGSQVVRGRIDAVYCRDEHGLPGPEGDAGDEPCCLVVDWKTSRAGEADPMQLAVYRAAWAELAGVAVERVRAAFYWVREDRLEVREDLPVAAELARLLTPAG